MFEVRHGSCSGRRVYDVGYEMFGSTAISPAARAVIFLLKFSRRVGGRPLSTPELPS